MLNNTPNEKSNENAGAYRRFCDFVKSVKNKRGKLIPIIIAALFWIISSIITKTACLSSAYVGLPCPACGITRSVTSLLRGDFAESFFLYPLLLPIIAVIGFSLWARVFKRGDFRKRYAEKALLVLIALILIVYVIRMFLFFPDTEPMEVNKNGILQNFIIFFL
jgi:hypothetical protein